MELLPCNDDLGPGRDDGEVAHHGGVFGDAKGAVEAECSGVKTDRVAGLKPKPPKSAFPADDRGRGRVVFVVSQIALSHDSMLSTRS